MVDSGLVAPADHDTLSLPAIQFTVEVSVYETWVGRRKGNEAYVIVGALTFTAVAVAKLL